MNFISEISTQLIQREEIIFAFLFGSQVSEKITPMSDIDIGIFVDHEKISSQDFPYGYKAHLLGKIEVSAGTPEIDLVILNDAPLLLKYACLHEGKQLFCKDNVMLSLFKIKTNFEYFDFLPLLEKINKAFYRGK